MSPCRFSGGSLPAWASCCCPAHSACATHMQEILVWTIRRSYCGTPPPVHNRATVLCTFTPGSEFEKCGFYGSIAGRFRCCASEVWCQPMGSWPMSCSLDSRLRFLKRCSLLLRTRCKCEGALHATMQKAASNKGDASFAGAAKWQKH